MVGPSAAAEVQWQVGRRIVSQVAGSGYRTTVWFTPSSEGAFVREWLAGVGRIDFHTQPPGRVGERLSQAFGRLFHGGARRVVLVGGDCPGVDRRLVSEAFTALGGHDVVIGPTWSGRFYLVGLNEPRPALFRGLRGPRTLAAVKSRSVGLGLRLRLLRPLREIRTLQDARVLGLLKSRSTIDGT
jgi:glycosyltransferase A (GT-A) superfamily protein (DUF2064 family)